MGKFGSFGRGCRGGGSYSSSNSSQADTNYERRDFGYNRRGGGRPFSRQRGYPAPSRAFHSNGNSKRRLFSENNIFSKRPKCENIYDDSRTTPDPRLKEPMPEAIVFPQLVKQHLQPGTIGKPIQLLCNFYRLITSDVIVYPYTLTIVNAKRKSPKPAKKAGKKIDFTPSFDQLQEHSCKVAKIMAKFIEDNPAIFHNVTFAFDPWRQSFCSTKPLDLPQNEFNQKIRLNGKNREFLIRLKRKSPLYLSETSGRIYRGKVDKLSKQVTLVLDTVLRFIMAKSFDNFGWKFYDFASNEPSKLRNFKYHEFIRGFMHTVHQTEIGLAMNLHLQTGCIISRTYTDLVHFVSDVAQVKQLEGERLQDWQMRFVNRAVGGLKVYDLRSPDVAYEVDCIVAMTPMKRYVQFQNGDKGAQCLSMYEVFQRKLNITLKEYPLVKIKRTQKFYLPMELCRLVDKQFMRRMPAVVKDEMLERKAIPPNVYFNTASAMIKEFVEKEPELLKQFGLEVVGKPTSLCGRVLPAPKLLNSNEDDPFYEAVEPPKIWAVICLDKDISMFQLESFLLQMRTTADKFGLHLGPPTRVDIESIQSVDEVKTILEKVMDELQHVELFFFALPKKHPTIRNTNDLYDLLKHICEQEYGVVSQCINTKFIQKIPDSYFEHLLLKVNAKLGGVNNCFDPEAVKSLPFDSSHTMIVGIDLYHPKEGLRKVKSAIAVVVSSCDNLLAKYSASIRVQKKHQEIIGELTEMFDELLAEYHHYNGRYPENVIVFRNAISNGNFQYLQSEEIPALQRSANRTGCRINLTVIVLQRGSRVRFALPEPVITDGVANYNPPSGTVVDQYVVSPHSKEFFLVSQTNEHVISRPTKYVVFRDDLDLSTDQLQQTCFYLCHNLARTRKAVGSPIAVRYADLCSRRAVQHVDAQLMTNSFHTTTDEEMLIAKLNTLVKVSEKVKNFLYYC